MLPRQQTLRAAHYFKEDHPWNKGLVFFASCVEATSKGRLKIDIFNGGILGSEAQTMQFVKDVWQSSSNRNLQMRSTEH